MSLTPGTRLGAYQIVASLGSGGMGEVYRAHDARLGRDVALKVLPADMAADPSRLERFTREARAIAALNHPHIVTIYSTEEADGIRFLTMELVEGQPLDALIPASGMPLARFLDLAMPLADALNAAHQKHITHRDLKPANVMVASDGRLKVLDFGLARVGAQHPTNQTIEATRQLLTGEGTIVGTMPYMSPEQVEGKQLDHRTDLFSLGVMFHEMLAGTRPFTGASSPQLMSSILRDTPSSTSDLRADVPDTLSRLITRCLEKEPDDRVQTARDVYNELRLVLKQLESGSSRGASSATAGVAAVAGSLWIAVLPFTTRSSDPEGEALAAGLTEDITAGLARFPSLSVVALQSAASFKGSPLDVRQIAERLRARYVMGGSVRKSASGVRVTAHLTDARSGGQLWTDTYDRALEQTDIYAIQDDVTDHVVSTIADKTGVLARSMVQTVRGLPLDKLSAVELVYRCWGAQLNPSPSQHEELRRAVESFLARQPDEPELWAQLSQSYTFEHSLWFNPLPAPLVRARRAARRAIELDPANQEGWVSLGLACFHDHDEPGLLEAVDRVLRLNPRASNAVAWMGNVLTHTGAYDRGCQITERAMALNASHAGWYHFAPFNRAFARGDFHEALKCARRVNIAGFHWMHLAIAAAAGHLGLSAEGAAAVEALHSVAPALADEQNLREMVTRWYWEEEVIESFLDGVRRSRESANAPESVSVPSRPQSSPSAEAQARRPPSSAATAPGTWIAVLPITSVASDEDSRALADGLTEDITAGLARFAYLSVVAEHSARQHKGTTADVRQIGKALGARYILDGGIRRGGTSIRISTRLVDAESGAQLWSETYTREIEPDHLLTVQDDVTDRVVATVADVHGVLLRSASVNVRAVPIDQLKPEELRLRYWAYHRQHAPDEHGLLRDRFERLAEEQPAFAPFRAALAHLYLHEYGFGFNARPEPLLRARQAVDSALTLDSLSQHAWEALAFLQFFEQDREGFAHAADRVLALNPRNANAMALMGILFVHAGELERGAALADRAMAINPDHPGWYQIARGSGDYASGKFESALRSAKRINMPQHLWAHALVAMSSAQLGRTAEALAALETLLALEPAFADEAVMVAAARRWKWLPEHAERMVDGYRKAMALRREAAGARPASDAATGAAAGVASAGIGAVAVARQAHAKGLRIAVLPFTSRGGEAAAALAEGLTDDITTGLSRFGYLRVLSRAAAAASTGGVTDARATGVRLGARYLLEGSVRTAGNTVRVTVRLIDTETDANLWADNIDRDDAMGGFALQDEVASRIVATVGDPTGVLAHAMAMTLSDVQLDRLTVAELTIRYGVYRHHLRSEEHGRLREAFERALELEPRAAEGWACLANLYSHEYSLGSNPLADAHGRHRRAAERAVEIDPGSQTAWLSLAALHLFARDASALRVAAERVVSLNPLNADALAQCSIYLVAAADHERAGALFARAAELKPQHPGWYHYTSYSIHYHRGEYEDALREAKLINMPAVPQAGLAAAICAGQLGRETVARLALEAVRRINPELITPAGARRVWSVWNWDEQFIDHQVEGLEKALALAGERQLSSSPGARPPSDARGGGIDLSVDVRPFAVRTGDHEAAELADGLTENITTGLARFPYLRVRAGRPAADEAQPPSGTSTLTSGSRFVIDGGVKRSGRAVRVNVRLLEAASGTTLFAEQYDRDGSEGAFAIQDEIGDRVVATLADDGGALYRLFAAAVKTSNDRKHDTLRLFVRFGEFVEHFTRDEHSVLRDQYEALVEQQPSNATAWAHLAILYGLEVFFGFNPLPNAVARVRRAAERAVALDNTNQGAWYALADAAFFERNAAGFRAAADRAIELNPLRSRTVGALGLLRAFAGDPAAGAALVTRAISLNPRQPGWFHLVLFLDAFQNRDADRALGAAARINLPQVPVDGRLFAIAAAGRFGRAPEAAAAIDELRRDYPHLLDAHRARDEWAIRIWDSALLDSLVDGFESALNAHAAAPPASTSETGSTPGIAAPQTDAALDLTVLPFTARAGDEPGSSLASGLTDDLTAALARFSYLRVVSREQAGSEARYALEGSVRTSGASIRVSARLVDVESGAHLWAENFDHDLGAGPFAVQDEVSGKIAARVADPSGVLVRSMASSLTSKPDDSMTVFDLTLQFFAYLDTFTAEQHARLRDGLEKALDRAPNNATGWAVLADLYAQERVLGHNPRPDSVGRQRQAAERAIAIDATCQYGWVNLASAHYLSGDVAAFRHEAERAIALNPLNTHVLGQMGSGLALSGSWERGAALIRHALELNPNLARHVHVIPFLDHYRRGEDEAALADAKKINIPGLHNGHFARAVAAGQLQRREEAQTALDDLRRVRPEMTDPASARATLSGWLHDAALVDRLIEGLAKALALTGSRERRSPAISSSGASIVDTAASHLTMAVAAFTSRGGESAEALAEKLTDDIRTGLSRFSYLRVVAPAPVTTGARYVLEGSVRRETAAFQVSARLIDSSSGAHMWAETYEQPLKTTLGKRVHARMRARGIISGPDTRTVPDDIATRVTATVADVNGVLVRSMVAALRQRPLRDLTVSELVVRFFGFLETFDPAEHAALRDRLTEALAAEPGHADGWACLSALIEHEHSHGLNPQPRSLDRARAAAERSIAANPVCQQGWCAMASAAFFARDAAGVSIAAERAIAINPLNTATVAVCGMFLARSGHWERGMEVVRQAMRPNPHYPGWLHVVPFVYHYRRNEYAEALQHAKQINMPSFAKSFVCVAAAAGQLGLREDARAALDGLARIDPANVEVTQVRDMFASWIWSGEDLDHLLDGFGKAKALIAGSVGQTPAVAGTSIAVLPFADLSAEKDQGWFCDGIAEEILNALAQLPGLRVAARTSAFSFRGRDDAAKAIGETLGVGSVLEGSVRRAGDRVRITVQLVDPLKGFQIWSDRYDRELKDIFEIQDEIARSVAARLKVALGSGTERRLVPAQTPNIEAYELYLKGRSLLYRRGASILPALDHFRRAVEIDPDFAPAWAGIGDAYVVCGYFGLLPGSEVRRQGLAAARRALALDPNSADAFTSLAALRHICENDIDGSGAAFRKALELNPAYVQARCWYALFYLQAALGELEAGVAEARQAQEMDPLSAYTATILCVALVAAGRAAEGLEEGRKAVAIDPQSFVAQWGLGLALLFANQLDEAESVLEQAAAMSDRHHFAIVNLAMTHARKGEPDRARALHEELVRRATTTRFVPAAQLAVSADAAGDREQALVFARQALEDREPPFILLSRNWPDYAELRRDARFVALIRTLDEQGAGDSNPS